MTPQEESIWYMVHEWCEQQYHYIPDQSRRVLMDKINEMINSSTYNQENMRTAFYKGADAWMQNPDALETIFNNFINKQP